MTVTRLTPVIAAIWVAKAAGAGCKLLGRQGVTWAGKIALKIYPPILQELAAEVRKDIFVVCGTTKLSAITPDPIC